MSPPTTVRALVVGCGKIADAHVEEIRKVPGGEVVAVCDREPLMAEQLARRYGVPRHGDDLARLLEEGHPDVVHITTPPASHLAIARQAMDAGCHVYVEKPFALDHAETVALLDHARRTGRKVTVGHSFHFDPVMVAARRLVREGVVGEPVHVESLLGYNLSGPFGTALLADRAHWVHRLPGRLVQNNIDHILHKIAEFVPDEAPQIVAVGAIRRDVRFGDERDELVDELRATIIGEKTTGYATFTSHAAPVQHVARLYGTRNTITLDFAARTLTFVHGEHLPSQIGRLLPAFGQGWDYTRQAFKNVYRFARADFQFFAGMRELIERLYESIRTDGEPPISYDRIARVAAWTDEVVAQTTGRRNTP